MSDVWSASMSTKAFVWKCLFSPVNASEAGVTYPAPRKGHIAVVIPGAQPLLVSDHLHQLHACSVILYYGATFGMQFWHLQVEPTGLIDTVLSLLGP